MEAALVQRPRVHAEPSAKEADEAQEDCGGGGGVGQWCGFHYPTEDALERDLLMELFAEGQRQGLQGGGGVRG